jgi:hypothetical protein
VTTEADAKLITLAAAQEKAKAQLEAVKASYKGKGATLHRQYSFAAYVYDREADLVQYAGRWNVNNQKRAVEQAAWRLYTGFFKRFRDYAWLIINTQKGVVACSEEDLKAAPAKKMLGYAVYHRHLDLAKAETAIVERFLPSASEKRFDYAIARSAAAPSDVKIVNLTRDAAAANAKYAELCSSRTTDPTEFNICVRGNSGQNRFWAPVSLMKGRQANHDVYALLADYVQ